MKEHWQKIIIGVLFISLFAVANSYITLSAKYDWLVNNYKQVQQTLTQQTALIVELRQKAIPRNFESFNELQSWVNTWEVENKPTVLSILNHTFVFGGNDELYSQYWDCDDISEAMQRDAHKDGLLMSIAPLDSEGTIYDTKVSEFGDHAGCLAETENKYWYIEPQTGEITPIVRRD